MERIVINPIDDAHWLSLRTKDLTSTDVAALFGLSPYKTRFELWQEKRHGDRVPFTDNDRAKWGRRLESVVATGIAEDQGWTVRPMKEYVRLPDVRIGSSFDFRIQNGPTSGDDDADHILEVKTVDFLAFRDGWTIDQDFIEAPPHIELQVQHQMLVSGLRRAYIGVMVGGNRIEVIQRDADDEVHAGIMAEAAKFWASINENRPPDPVMPDDADALIRLNSFAEPGKLIDLRGDASMSEMLAEYARLGTEAKVIDESRKVLKADLLQRIGDAEKVLTDAGKISAGVTGPTDVAAFTRAAFRQFRFYPNKAKP